MSHPSRSPLPSRPAEPNRLATLSHKAWASAVLALSVLSCAEAPDPAFNGRTLPAPRPPRELQGTNSDGSTFDLQNLNTDFALVFFGFTSCPDVCPITLGNLSRVRQILGENGSRVSVVFASVDPPRDTLERIGQYVSAFDPEAYGVRLDEAQLGRTVESFGLIVQAQPPFDPDVPENYTVDHTATLFLVDQQARVVLTYSAYTDPALIAGDLHQLIAAL